MNISRRVYTARDFIVLSRGRERYKGSANSPSSCSGFSSLLFRHHFRPSNFPLPTHYHFSSSTMDFRQMHDLQNALQAAWGISDPNAFVQPQYRRRASYMYHKNVYQALVDLTKLQAPRESVYSSFSVVSYTYTLRHPSGHCK